MQWPSTFSKLYLYSSVILRCLFTSWHGPWIRGSYLGCVTYCLCCTDRCQFDTGQQICAKISSIKYDKYESVLELYGCINSRLFNVSKPFKVCGNIAMEIKLPPPPPRQFCEMLNSGSSVTGRVQIFGNSPNESNFIHEEIKSRLNTGNASYYSVQNLISSSFLSKNIKI